MEQASANLPNDFSYGVTEYESDTSSVGSYVLNLVRLGYAVVPPSMVNADLPAVSEQFSIISSEYAESEMLKEDKKDPHTIRAPLLKSEIFLQLAQTDVILEIVGQVMQTKFILNQQNLVTNPANQKFSQARWHRDLPYQHFVANRPLAVNALFCVDDFLPTNGASFVLPASHLFGTFPTLEFVYLNQKQILAPAGSMILMDGMTFHRGGENDSSFDRRAVNHVYSLPIISQQIELNLENFDYDVNEEDQNILGLSFRSARSPAEYKSSQTIKGRK